MCKSLIRSTIQGQKDETPCSCKLVEDGRETIRSGLPDGSLTGNGPRIRGFRGLKINIAKRLGIKTRADIIRSLGAETSLYYHSPFLHSHMFDIGIIGFLQTPQAEHGSIRPCN